MKEIICALVFLGLILAYACGEKNCPSIEVGSIDLDRQTIDLLPYESGENLVFYNEAGEELTFSIEVVNEEYPICVNYLCRSLDPYAQRTCEYYQAEGLRNILRLADQDLLIELVGAVENYEEESTLFYDFFSINMSGLGNQVRGEYISFVHFDDPEFSQEQTILKDPLLSISDINLIDKNFQDVLHTAEGEDMVYFKNGLGLIGLRLGGEAWVLR